MGTQISNRKRTLTMLGTIIAQFALGSVYTWSLFNALLADKLSEPVNNVALSFGVLSLALAVASSLAGKLQERFSVRQITISAGILLGISLLLTAQVSNIFYLYICAGFLLGFADGTGYLLTLSNCVKFFPNHKGLVSACSIGAYGLGSLGFKYINMYLLDNYGLEGSFVMWGSIAMVMVIVGGMMMHDAPKLALSPDQAQNTARNFSLAETIKTNQFWMLALVFLTVCMSGLYVIGVAKDIAENYAHLSISAATSTIALVAIANLSGRLVLGILSDRIARINVITIALTICLIGVSLLLFFPLDDVSFYASIACVVFAFGGTITVFPSLVSDFFGLDNLTKNYGLMYLNFGIGGLLGSVVASVFGGFSATFYLMLTMIVISIVITFIIKFPTKESVTMFDNNNNNNNNNMPCPA
jgi:OFA family oxalate/formate antiporter-like MFS transporter